MSKEEPRTCWAVVSGTYADYRVAAIFEAEADADAFAATESYFDVEEFPFHPAKDKQA